jgi:diaminohydroxyphosphoribosylaminopyrimidine deaminase/5-amino-6-(5-phosphoribosylamino)uracil reductase
MTSEAEDHARMGQALALARRVLGQTWPNPAVGCVIGREGRVLGRGHTQPSGRPHAEQVALAQARERHGTEALRGATAWITLEPCAHHGRTPPCADALVAAGIARVVAAIRDPDPRVNGAGFDRLRAAGVAVETGCRAAEATRQQAGFLSRIQRGRPWLTLKLAATLDGRIATATGESRWITGSDSRARVHLMRAMSDAVLVGGGTARADDPMLDVRLPGLTDRRPVRVVVDSMLTLGTGSRLVRSAAAQPLWLLHGEDASAARRDRLIALGVRGMPVRRGPDGRLDPRAMLDAMGEQGLTRVLCEGGGALAASLLSASLVDELALFTAGKAIGAEGHPALGALGLERLADAPPFTLERVEQLGGDVLTRWRAGAAG